MESTIYKSALMIIGGLALPGLALLFPLGRAWLHILLGNYAAAAKIYEKRLAQHPQRLHLYLRLAVLYILAGRRDESALTAYRIICDISRAIKMAVETRPVNNAPRICSTPVAI